MCLEMHLLLLLLGEKSADWGVQEIASLEEVELEDEQVAGNNTTKLGNKVASSLSRSTCASSVLAPLHTATKRNYPA